MTKPPRQLDSRIEIVTPENIAFDYVLAGPFRRLPAFLIDVAIRIGVLLAFAFACMYAFSMASMTGFGMGVTFVAWFALSWFYGGVFETVWNGQTPGKRMLGLRVLTVDGQPINALQAILRNILRDVDAMPVLGSAGGEVVLPFYMLGLIVMMANDRYQRLGDLASGTIVVVEGRSLLRGLAPVAKPEVIELSHALPVNLVVNRGIAHALTAYVARRRLFSPGRRVEIARTLAEPLGERYGLPIDTDPDRLLCALYYRAFVADKTAADREPPARQPRVAEVARR